MRSGQLFTEMRLICQVAILALDLLLSDGELNMYLLSTCKQIICKKKFPISLEKKEQCTCKSRLLAATLLSACKRIRALIQTYMYYTFQ